MIEVQAKEHVIVLSPTGDFDLATAPALDQPLQSAVDGPWRVVVVDLKNTTFMDFAGSEPLRRAATGCAQRGKRLVIVNGRPHLVRLLTLVGLGPHLVPSSRDTEPDDVRPSAIPPEASSP